MNNLLNGNIYKLGLTSKEFWLSIYFIIVMLSVEYYNSFRSSIRQLIEKQNIALRWTIYIALILIILIFGNYG